MYIDNVNKYLPLWIKQEFIQRGWKLYYSDIITWTKYDAEKLGGYCWAEKKEICFSGKSNNPLVMTLHEFIHFGIAVGIIPITKNEMNKIWNERDKISYYCGSYATANEEECVAVAFASILRYGINILKDGCENTIILYNKYFQR